MSGKRMFVTNLLQIVALKIVFNDWFDMTTVGYTSKSFLNVRSVRRTFSLVCSAVFLNYSISDIKIQISTFGKILATIYIYIYILSVFCYYLSYVSEFFFIILKFECGIHALVYISILKHCSVCCCALHCAALSLCFVYGIASTNSSLSVGEIHYFQMLD